MEYSIERLTSKARAIVIGSVFIMGAVACSETEPVCIDDKDCDGISNAVDLLPDVADSPDFDNDGIPNDSDLFPYLPSNGTSLPVDILNDPVTTTLGITPSTSIQPAIPNSTTTTNNALCTFGLKPDKDGDGIPDACDTNYDQGVKDTDNDGLPDSIDTHPNSSDWDNDGLLDGYDSNPNENQKNQEEQRRKEREQQKREEERREQERIEEQRRQDQLNED